MDQSTLQEHCTSTRASCVVGGNSCVFVSGTVCRCAAVVRALSALHRDRRQGGDTGDPGAERGTLGTGVLMAERRQRRQSRAGFGRVVRPGGNLFALNASRNLDRYRSISFTGAQLCRPYNCVPFLDELCLAGWLSHCAGVGCCADDCLLLM